MKTPNQELNVTEQATDSEIKQAYLQKVRENPPDRDQQRFQQIQTAYQAIKDAKSRTSYELFNFSEPDFIELLGTVCQCDMPPPVLSANDFMSLLGGSIEDKMLLNIFPKNRT